MADVEIYDFVVLGGGSAGYAAARTAVGLGLKTAVIDGAEELGGLCILRGCMPSKTLIESANRNLVIENAAEFGLEARQGPVQTQVIRDRKRRLIEDFASYRQGQLADGRFTLIRGWASFSGVQGEGDVRLSVQEREGASREVTARSVLIATGSVITPPEISGLVETGFWTSDTLLDAAEVPDSFVVLGGGAIALEMAHYLDGIGRDVTVVQRSDQLLSDMDSDLAQVVEEAFVERGMVVHTGTKISRVENQNGLKRVVFTSTETGGETFVEAAEILMALGRKPATGKLEAHSVSVELTKSGHVKVAETQQTTNPRIFAAGDVCGPFEIVHLAIQQGEIAAKNAAAVLAGQELKHRMDYRCKLYGIFTAPQVAAVGLSEKEAKKNGTPYLTASYPFNDHGKSMVMGEMHGFVKLLAEPVTGRILGGAVVGPEATEIIHEVVIAMHLRATVVQLASAPHYHPTLSEVWTYPAEEIMDALEAPVL